MCSFPSFFFHHIRFNLLKVDFCLNTFGNQILCKARSQAVLYTSRFFILFSSAFFTVRDAVSCMASRPQAVFVFTSRSETHTSRCCNHCEMLQCTGYTTRTSAVFSASRASDRNAFELQRANVEIWDESHFITSADEDESLTPPNDTRDEDRSSEVTSQGRTNTQNPWLNNTKTQTCENWRHNEDNQTTKRYNLNFSFLSACHCALSLCLTVSPPTPLPLLRSSSLHPVHLCINWRLKLMRTYIILLGWSGDVHI